MYSYIMHYLIDFLFITNSNPKSNSNYKLRVHKLKRQIGNHLNRQSVAVHTLIIITYNRKNIDGYSIYYSCQN